MKEINLQERKIEELERRIKWLEDWVATHRCTEYPPQIRKVIGKPLDTKWIPEVEG